MLRASRHALCATLSTLAMIAGSPVLAQTVNAEDAPLDEAADISDGGELGEADAAGAGGDIVVTGSRLPANGNSSPTPVTVTSTSELQQTTPSSIADALNKLPVFTGSSSPRTLNNSSINSAGNYLNLRGIGANRNLVLFDGQRFVATTQNGLIDVNTIPQLLVQRVEVVTGGASAVYGSDAVTGVVNFIVDKNFNGLKTMGQYGISERGDNASQRFGIAGGLPVFGGRGHFEASYEYYSSDGIGSQFDRRLGTLVYGEQGAGTVANPFHLVANTRASTNSFGGLISSGPLAGQQFTAPGVLAPFVNGTSTGSAGIQSGGSGTYRERGLLASLRSHQGFARFDYDLADDIAFHVQVTGTKAKNLNIHSPFFFQNYSFAADNPYLPQSARDTMAAAGTQSFTFSRLYRLPEAPYNSTRAEVENLYVNTGLEGKLGGFSWSVDYSYGEAKQTVTSVNNINNPRLMAALDAVRDSGGQIVCRVTVTNPGLYPGCTPINPFGSTDGAAIGYALGDTAYTLRNKMHDVAATVTGTLFELPAGPVNVAVNGEYRRISFVNSSTSEPSVLANCTGLRFNCGATTAEYVLARTASGRAKQTIAEVAGEINVPLLRDVPFIHSLDLSGAFRYADYTTSGSAKTWKIGVDWGITSELRFRATRSQDIRAPTLNDLFAPSTLSLTGFTDLHTGTSSLVSSETVGNPNLVPEVAQTLTVGGVYRPEWLPGFSIAIDYYRIKIDDAISSIGGNNAATQAECEASNGVSPLCDLYIRPLPFSDRTAANYPTLIRTQGLNVASLLAEGVDAEINYRIGLGSGELSLRALGTYMPKLETQQFAGAVLINDAGAATGVPKYKLTLFVRYQTGGFSLDVQERWRSALKQSGNPTLVFSDPKVPAAAYTDLNIAYRFEDVKGSPQFFLSVQNLLDKKPPVYASPIVSSTPGFGYPTYGSDDVVGRYFTLGVRAQF